MIAFSKALALEEARRDHGQRGLPGRAAKTALPEGRARRPGRQRRDLVDRVPVGRAAGAPHDVARAVLFFASPAADFLTGQVLAVGGGGCSSL